MFVASILVCGGGECIRSGRENQDAVKMKFQIWAYGGNRPGDFLFIRMSGTIAGSIRGWYSSSHCHAASPGLIKRGRLAHTIHSHNPFPYPSHRNPTPHQIFHLPRSATEAEIKARCPCFSVIDITIC